MKLPDAATLMAIQAMVESMGGRLVRVGESLPEKPEQGICEYQATKMDKAAFKRERKRLRNLQQKKGNTNDQ